MKWKPLGKTGLMVTSTALGCLPIQRVGMDEAVRILRRAAEAGINFFDTARAYSDSEEKLGNALCDVRKSVHIASKTGARTADMLWRHLEASLGHLKTDYIDVYQFHNPKFVPKPGGEDGLYDAALEAKRQGLIRHIGISQHTLALALEAARSGLYETLQFPFSHLASAEEVELLALCEKENVGFICMKAMSGGLIADASLPFAYIRQFPHAVPIWGVQRMEELEQFLALEENPPVLDAAMQKRIDEDRAALSGAFCRSCGYCLPCPQDIPIPTANRMKQLITRSPDTKWMTDDWQASMGRVEACTRCGACAARCPYGLLPYETMPEHLAFYRAYVKKNA